MLKNKDMVRKQTETPKIKNTINYSLRYSRKCY